MVDKKVFWDLIVLYFPALTTFLALWMFRDAIITQIALLATFYAMPKAYNKYCRRFMWDDDQEIISFKGMPRTQKKELLKESKISEKD